jgi:hypothetical protein
VHKEQKDKDSKFSKLNLKAEEKKVNLFYLKDILIKESSSNQDKMEALYKIKRNLNKPVFAQAMRSLLNEFEKIEDVFIQREIIQAIQVSSQAQLIQPLKDLIKNPKVEDEIRDDIQQALDVMAIIPRQPKSFKSVCHSKSHTNSNGFD